MSSASPPRGDSVGDQAATAAPTLPPFPRRRRRASPGKMPAGGGRWRRWSLRAHGALVRGLEVVGARLFRRVAMLRRELRRLRPAVLPRLSYGREHASSRGRALMGEAVLLGRGSGGLASMRRGRWHGSRSRSWCWYARGVGWYLWRCMGYALLLDGVPALCRRSGSTMVPPGLARSVPCVLLCVSLCGCFFCYLFLL